MGEIVKILIPVLLFAGIALVVGIMLAVASKVFEVKRNPKVEAIRNILPGANCGGCKCSGCDDFAEKVAEGKASVSACAVGGAEVSRAIASILGVEAENPVRMRAQVMCSGTNDLAKKKYRYEGVRDCIAAAKLGGGDKMCPNGCIGFGTCVKNCPFDAISIVNGVAVVDYEKCQGCGICTDVCPKHIIKLIPFHSAHWVGCMSADKGAVTRQYCEAGCISCHLCEKACPSGAITVSDFLAGIDYDKCTGCGACVQKCPRKIIWSSETQDNKLIIIRDDLI